MAERLQSKNAAAFGIVIGLGDGFIIANVLNKVKLLTLMGGNFGLEAHAAKRINSRLKIRILCILHSFELQIFEFSLDGGFIPETIVFQGVSDIDDAAFFDKMQIIS